MKVESFTEKYPEEVEAFSKTWVEYMRYCYKVESGEGTGEDVQLARHQNRVTTSLMDLDRDTKGYPTVPLEVGNLINMKNILRSFITIHYRKCVHFLSAVLISLNLRFCFWTATRSGPMEAHQGTY